MTKPHSSVTDFIQLLNERQNHFYNPSTTDFPLVSIISSFFNAHQYFEETYQSIIQQTCQDFEWILVDDCSTDPESIALFKSLPQKSPKIKTFYHQYNQGVSRGRNTAISNASGKYLFFMDTDDILDPTYMEKCVLFLETHSDFSFVNSYSVGFQAQEYWWAHGFDKPSRFIEQNWITYMVMYRKVDFDRLGGFDEQLRFYEDWERWLKAIANQQKGWTIPEYLHCCRRLNTGLLATSRNKISEEQKVTELIKSRYQSFFLENPVEDISLRNPSPFEINFKTRHLDVKSPLDRQRTGKRILCFFPYLEIGGADKFNLDLLTILAERGYEITIATTLKSEHLWHHHFYKITPDIFHLANFLPDSYWLDFSRYIIESRQIDVFFISNSSIAYYFLPFLRAEFPDVAFVDYTHIYDPDWKGWGYPRISCQLSRLLDLQFVSSHHLAEFYQSLNCETQKKLKTCYTNIDVNQWVFDPRKRQEMRSNLGISEKTVVLIYPARIVAQKRPLFLIDIIKKLAERDLPICVLVLGSGHLLPEMQEKVSQLGLESFFQFLPPVNPEQTPSFYSAADIFLLPSEYEGISLAMYEAMSMQLPVVASEVGGQAELVTPETGFLIPKSQGDEKEVQQYLEVLVPLIKDATLRRQVGDLARRRVAESFSLTVMGNCMEAIIAEAIQLRQTSSPSETDLVLASEMLTLALYSTHVESELARELARLTEDYHNLALQHNQHLEEYNQHNQHLEQHNQQLQGRIEAMESSKFWQIRKRWFKTKQRLGFTQEEP